MTTNEPEVETFRTRLTGFDEAVQAEIRTIIEEAVLRAMAVVRRAEQSAARLRYLAFLESEEAEVVTDSRQSGVKSRALAATNGKRTPPAPSPAAKVNGPTQQYDGAQTTDGNGLPRRNGKLDLEAALAGVNLPKSPQSARHLMLSILAQKGEPVPFPVLDHAVIANGMTRSAGEKSRRTMEQTGLVERVGKKLAITALGEAALVAFDGSDGHS